MQKFFFLIIGNIRKPRNRKNYRNVKYGKTIKVQKMEKEKEEKIYDPNNAKQKNSINCKITPKILKIEK